MKLSERSILCLTVAIALAVWASHSIFWWAHLEGDAPWYPILSLKILHGHNYLMTDGQAHGGTLILYLRALLFKLFGVSYFLGFFINGVFVAAGAALWARFATRVSGPVAGLVMGLLGAVATERFARSACTDYFVFTLVSGGLMLNFAEALARRPAITRRDAFLGGLLVGFSWYICRFSALYLVAAGLFFLGLIPEQRRVIWVPTRGELLRGKINRALVWVVGIGLLLSVLAFFTNDQFLGVNAEANLKVVVLIAAATWLKHRWRVLPDAALRLGIFAVGAVIGLIPEIAFKILVHTPDRVTGLVRWRDIQLMASGLPSLVGENFSFYHPLSWGLVAAGCSVALVALGAGRRHHLLFVAPVLLCVGSWLTIHTYMHLPSQYFFPAFYPIYLAAAFACAQSRLKPLAWALAAAVLAIGVVDDASNAFAPNDIADSHVLETLDELSAKWDVHEGFGQQTSDYNIMWASQNKWWLPEFNNDPRFVSEQPRVHAARRVFLVYSDKDRLGMFMPPNYKVLERRELGHSFRVFVLEKEGASGT